MRARGLAAVAVGLVAGAGLLVATDGRPAGLELAPPTAAIVVPAGDVAAARATLPTLVVAPDVLLGRGSGYDRDARFGRWPSIGGGCTLDDEVLAEELDDAELGAARPGGVWCDVRGGVLEGEHVTRDEVDVDHVVPLRLAWSSGAAGWSDARRRELATDRRNLRAELAATNRAGGEDGPEVSDPADDDPGRCRYGVAFVLVADEYGLTVTAARRAALEGLVARCGS